MPTTLQTDLPEDLIRSLHQAVPPILQQRDRERGVDWLQRVFVDFVALESHIALLHQLTGITFNYPRPRRDCPSAVSFVARPTGSAVGYAEPLPESQQLAIIEGGPAVLRDPQRFSDRQLGELFLNPAALYDLFDLIDDLIPEAWFGVVTQVGQELLASSRPRAPGLAVASPAAPNAGRRRWQGAALAMAACLLLAGTIFYWTLLRPDVPGTYEVQVALLDGKVRGGNDEDSRLEIRSNLDGFVTILALSPGQRPVLLPGIGGDPVRVKPRELGISPPFPPGARQASRALVVVTATPADGSIRRALRGGVYGPDQIDQLQADLQKLLETENYHRMVFTQVDLKRAGK